MRRYSITRRIVSLVLAVELVSAVCVTAFAFFYERHTHFHSFDIALQGRADTVMGSVTESPDEGTEAVTLDMADLSLPKEALFAVREENGQELGRSRNWIDLDEDLWKGADGFVNLRVAGREYRAIRMHGLRIVDPGVANVRHSMVVLVAAPTRWVWQEVFGAVRMFALANVVLLLLTAVLVPMLVRRSIGPLTMLAAEAGRISPERWRFQPAEEIRSVEELRPLVEALEGVIGRLERSFAQQRQFVSDGAHELKTAVSVVKSSVQLLGLRARTAQEYAEGLERCNADCARMEDLAHKMLLLARVEEFAPAQASERTEIMDGIRSAMVELAPIAELRKVELRSDGQRDLTAAIAPEMWRSVCVNVLLNAVQHSPSYGVVRMTASRRGDVVLCVVEDEGEGVPASALPYIFDRFYRGDPSRSRRTGGTGLGLAICKAILDRAAGKISIENIALGGTRVKIELPLAAAMALPREGVTVS
ncbi:MAG TPA: HAMP domain-containing sensor histidine kinase [Acidisarcina sp.]|nr:HAMP domain-containing sensor histidine kinase [Acidisarcina sp.]